MAWQEDLAELDRTLAEGRISADEYRRRRDELLASASGAAPQQPPQTNGPFGAPFRWEASQPPQGGPNPDATQVVTPGQPPVAQPPVAQPPLSPPQGQPPVPQPAANPEATQVVSAQQRPVDADRTQYVRPVAPPPNQMPPQQPQPGGWGGAAPANTPPWGNDQGFGVVGEQTPSWIAQGPEVFDESGGGGGKKWLAIVGIVVVLALIGGGIWFFTTRDSTTTGGGTQQQTTGAPPTTTTTKPKDGLEVAELPGVSQDQSGVQNFADVVAGKLLTAEENETFQASGAGRSRLGGSVVSGGELYTQVLTVRMTGAPEAKTAVDALGVLQAKYAMEPYTGTLPKGVTAFQTAPAGNGLGVVRAHYISKDVVVRVQVTGKDLAKVAKAFDDLLAAQIEQLAVDA
ncbi:hypothetical protein ABZ816_32950 [Actinosynnema sp. NPDC047251]|uniref:SHOCT domain-containing protein n=1 Tax=Saccharothrix espanaensis (strain ATCC 51144 / DSM 44229 / JCM 9112 / NBRC 15066 / NRRL 15764) TaxID=1179773 RepID=K3W437_SACES|nr:hypothetical protein [Saccharothrix espanaensis]CCH27403.1 hypothetical protein BN6_00710 [Saccharothrix espanaensis DSM 44229]